MAQQKKWIQGAIKNPGALTASAKKEGAVTSQGTIKKSWLQKAAKAPGKLGQRARLALTLSKMSKKKK